MIVFTKIEGTDKQMIGEGTVHVNPKEPGGGERFF